MEKNHVQYLLTVCYMPDIHYIHLFNTQNFLNWQQLFFIFYKKETNAKGLANFERQVLAALNTELGFESQPVSFHTPVLCFDQHDF